MRRLGIFVNTLALLVIGVLLLISLVSYSNAGETLQLFYVLALGIIFLAYSIILIKKAKSDLGYARRKLNEIDKIKREMEGLESAEKKVKEIKVHGAYIGSNKNKTYHLSTCRFSKLIKSEYREESNDINYFKKRKYKACKTCKPNKKN